MVLPSVGVAVLMLRDTAVAGRTTISAYAQIRSFIELPADTHPLIVATYRAGAAANLLICGPLLPEGVFPALLAAIIDPAGAE